MTDAELDAVRSGHDRAWKENPLPAAFYLTAAELERQIRARLREEIQWLRDTPWIFGNVEAQQQAAQLARIRHTASIRRGRLDRAH